MQKGLTALEISEYLKTGNYTIILDNDEFFIGPINEEDGGDWIYGGIPRS